MDSGLKVSGLTRHTCIPQLFIFANKITDNTYNCRLPEVRNTRPRRAKGKAIGPPWLRQAPTLPNTRSRARHASRRRSKGGHDNMVVQCFCQPYAISGFRNRRGTNSPLEFLVWASCRSSTKASSRCRVLLCCWRDIINVGMYILLCSKIKCDLMRSLR